MVLIEQILSFIVLVGILVFIHELGHFLAARWTGMRADVFAVGMGPRLVGWNKKTGFTFGKLPANLELEGHTDYRISAFPIGGYVKILGMVDESMDTDFATRPPQPWEFRSKGTLAKTFVISAGVIQNILLAIVLMFCLNYFGGKDYQNTTRIGVVTPNGLADRVGFRTGDRIVSVNGTAVQYFDEVPRLILAGGNEATVVVERNGTSVPLSVRTGADTGAAALDLVPEKSEIDIVKVNAGSPGAAAGIKAGDKIATIDGLPVASVVRATELIKSHKDRDVQLTVIRGGTVTPITAHPGKDGLLNIELDQKYLGTMYHRSYSFTESISAGWNDAWSFAGGTFEMIGKLLTGRARLKDSVGGPLKIAVYAQRAASEGFPEFIKLMALLSMTLACMNILPIPALDGGHLVFILVEGIIRREVPMKLRMAVQQAGFVLLLIFMVFVLVNDIG
ncbi:MAG: RIP metalloprotease RseP [Bacteroidetes bacterium]|nr:RIP metalloprotease RseP [Bacteroidota bacterium]